MERNLYIKYIYLKSIDEHIQKGKKLYLKSKPKIVSKDDDLDCIDFSVIDDTYGINYDVKAYNYHSEKSLTLTCSCDFKSKKNCKHKIAVLFLLNDLFEKNELPKVQKKFNQKKTKFKLERFDLFKLKLIATDQIESQADELIRLNKIKILTAEKGVIKAYSNAEQGKRYHISIQRNQEREFITSCDCDENSKPICCHKLAVMAEVFHSHGTNFFHPSTLTEDKEKLLNNRLLFAEKKKATSSYIKEKGKKPKLNYIGAKYLGELYSNTGDQIEDFSITTSKRTLFAVVIKAKENIGYFDIIPIKFKNLKKDNFDIINLNDNITSIKLRKEEKELIRLNKKASYDETFRDFILKDKGHHHDNVDNIDQLNEEDMISFFTFWSKRLQKLMLSVENNFPTYIIPSKKKFTAKNLSKIIINQEKIYNKLYLNKEKQKVNGSLYALISKVEIPLEENLLDSPMIFAHKNDIHFWANSHIIYLNYQYLKGDFANIAKAKWNKIIKYDLSHLLEHNNIFIDKDIVSQKHIDAFKTILEFEESPKYLVIKPLFDYQIGVYEFDKKATKVYESHGKQNILVRNIEKEQIIIDEISQFFLSEHISQVGNNLQFVVPKTFAVKNRWFLNLLQFLKENNILTKGINNLKKFKILETSPKTKIDVSYEVDWLDVDITLNLGDDETMSLEDLYNVFKKNSNHIELSNGKIFSLPDQWIRKYSLLFKLAEKNEPKKLRIKKKYSNVLELFEDENDILSLDGDIVTEKERITEKPDLDFDLDDKYYNHLREYQQIGLKWFIAMAKTFEGGILVDEMGLGKTLQSLSYLNYHIQEGKQNGLNIVVCPNSMIYTWEEEIKKFHFSAINPIVYHGTKRLPQLKKIKDYNLIITTYGTLREDINKLKEYEFNNLILDESHFINNITSKLSRAILTINAKHRFCLSGTPFQNNVYEVYSQINFINRGYLGSANYFRSQFGHFITKYNDEIAHRQLQKIISPFLLRRTKKQVVKELPEKTITNIFCEMTESQRKIYNSYASHFRKSVKGIIVEQGIDKGKFHILHALGILRQICNSPFLINSHYNLDLPKDSAKIDILFGYIKELSKHHKIVIFSQFLTTLSLIKEKLHASESYNYAYFDGSFSAKKRLAEVNKFQKDNDVRLFLISLKAGGLGINLTAAQYAFIIDPWWNPAIENQAIDRIHRIGQKKPVNAYKFICKDSIEEKILQLQDKKSKLVNSFLDEEALNAFKITEEEIDFLLT